MKRQEPQAPEVPPVGASVRLRFGVTEVVARVIEHRGPLGVGGQQIIRVRFQFGEVEEPIEIELPVDQVTVIDPAA